MAWTLAYEHKDNGERISGDKNQLIDDIRNGLPVRIALTYKDERMATAFDAAVLFVNYGEVFAQTAWASADWLAGDEKVMSYLTPHSTYMLSISTSGSVRRRSLRLPDGALDDGTFPFGAKWFVNRG